MARLAPIRLAGTIAATALCAAAATEAHAQSTGQQVVIDQVQLGDVFAGQTLNVVDAQAETAATTSAQGNQASGAAQDVDLSVIADQTMAGSAEAETTVVTGGDTQGPVNVLTQAGGAYLAASAYDGDLTASARQDTTGDRVRAISDVGDTNDRLLGGASVSASAIANTTALYGEGSVVRGDVAQDADTDVRAYSRIQAQYIPAEAEANAQAAANAVEVNSVQTSGQDLILRQTSSGPVIQGEASANAGNAWDLAARARASANQAALYNQGGSVVVDTAQENASYVRAAALTTAYDYGAATARAQAAGNEVSIGNNDIFVEIDNAQINSGGVDAEATFVGTNGYDVVVGAQAVGNSITGYACSECDASLTATSNQRNDADVTARASSTTYGSGRSTVGSASAVGNAATFYVSRSGQ